MAGQASKTVIGAFVMGALALVVAGVVILGSGRFFAEKRTWVLYFDGSVKGLNVGAPVSFRGVRIGSVTDIQLRVDPKELSTQIPVFIETEPRNFTVVGEDPSIIKRYSKAEHRRLAKRLVEKGLRAQLQMESFVTGKLMVGVDFLPDKPAILRGDGKIPEIPTVPSSMAELAKTVQNLPLKELGDRLVDTVAGIDRLIDSPGLKGAIRTLDELLKDIQNLVRHVDAELKPLASGIEAAVNDYGKLARDVDVQVEPLLTSIQSASDAARGAMVQAEKTLALEEGVPGELAAGLKGTLDEARAAMVNAKDALAGADEMIAENSPLRYELNNTLQELSAAARSIRLFADYLERHPEALIQGKGGPGGQ